MGHVTCGMHRDRRTGRPVEGPRCCWRCDRCPKCDPETGRLGRGDYCRDCAKALRDSGHVWSEYHQNYVTRAELDAVKRDLAARAGQATLPLTPAEEAGYDEVCAVYDSEAARRDPPDGLVVVIE